MFHEVTNAVIIAEQFITRYRKLCCVGQIRIKWLTAIHELFSIHHSQPVNVRFNQCFMFV
jgi:hypothetical protein